MSPPLPAQFSRAVGIAADGRAAGATQLGTKFHRMVQQYAIGLPVTMLDAIDPEVAQLQACVRSLVSAAPALFAAEVFPHSEYRRTWEFQGHLFTVIYDLLLMGGEAQIFDWKTYARPQRSNALAQNWQTRLYPLVLTMTTDMRPNSHDDYLFVQPKTRRT
ncbi:MAG: PD-(D/E)XK nuclease family protein, partial [Leptolyngbyaceae cyanobacterium SM1_3_5]|nr:PD-(D/E)XK nuclease family protein [Leptolyngbyaceae cyanobacterium SM1_3_5]